MILFSRQLTGNTSLLNSSPIHRLTAHVLQPSPTTSFWFRRICYVLSVCFIGLASPRRTGAMARAVPAVPAVTTLALTSPVYFSAARRRPPFPPHGLCFFSITGRMKKHKP